MMKWFKPDPVASLIKKIRQCPTEMLSKLIYDNKVDKAKLEQAINEQILSERAGITQAMEQLNKIIDREVSFGKILMGTIEQSRRDEVLQQFKQISGELLSNPDYVVSNSELNFQDENYQAFFAACKKCSAHAYMSGKFLVSLNIVLEKPLLSANNKMQFNY
ncbi:MAG: hypothetical protein ACD_46C00557G0001 [uncultured bacterium]|nr:MAG: hypothetical protein ACD_46C00557G0001 [uncultured bacterium]